MSLNINKLHELLLGKNLMPMKHFIMDGTCYFIEIFSILSGETFLLYIPSKYVFKISDKEKDSYKLKYIQISAEDIIGDENFLDITINANLNLAIETGKVEQHIEKSYHHEINLKEISDDDITGIKEIYMQVRRLKYSVKNIKYKLGIVWKNYIVYINRKDELESLYINKYSRDDTRKLYIVIDIETLYENTDKLLEDIKTVRIGVYNVLERNHDNNEKIFTKISENKKDIEGIPQKIISQKNHYDKMIANLEKMLAVFPDTEKNLLTNLGDIVSGKSDSLENDINRVTRKNTIEKELEKLSSTKSEVVNLLSTLKQKKEDTILLLDKIMYDNTIMFDRIVKNFSKLKELC